MARGALVKGMAKDIGTLSAKDKEVLYGTFPSASPYAGMPDEPIESEEGPVGTLMGVGGGVMMGKELLKGMVGTGGKMLGKAIAKRAAQKEAASVAPLGPMPPPGPHRVQVAKPVWDDNSMPAMEPINSAGDSLPAFSGSMPPAAPDLSSFPGRSGMDPLGYMDRRDLAQMAPGGIRQASAAPASESDAIRRQFNLGPDQSVAPANRSAWDTQVPISHELGPDGRGPRMPNNPNGWEESPNSTPPYNPNTHTTLPGLSDYRQAVPPREPLAFNQPPRPDPVYGDSQLRREAEHAAYYAGRRVPNERTDGNVDFFAGDRAATRDMEMTIPGMHPGRPGGTPTLIPPASELETGSHAYGDMLGNRRGVNMSSHAQPHKQDMLDDVPGRRGGDPRKVNIKKDDGISKAVKDAATRKVTVRK